MVVMMEDVVDQELSAALRVHYKACYDYRWDAARRRGEPVPSVADRFLAEVSAERGPALLASIAALIGEARRVPDPGGPLGAYGDALSRWAATHPEIDPREMHWVTTTLMTEHR